MPAGTTFRQAIHLYLNRNNKDWCKLGIDLLLGKPCDNVMTTAQSQFLPDNLMMTFDSAKSSTPLVISKKLTFGTQSPRGSRFIERIFTVVMTCQQQGRDVFGFMVNAVQAHFSGKGPPSLLLNSIKA